MRTIKEELLNYLNDLGDLKSGCINDLINSSDYYEYCDYCDDDLRLSAYDFTQELNKLKYDSDFVACAYHCNLLNHRNETINELLSYKQKVDILNSVDLHKYDSGECFTIYLSPTLKAIFY